MKRTEPVTNPSKWERLTLRTMIFIGVVCMMLFLKEILSTGAQYKFLYGMLVTTFIFACLKILHEWIHYFSITVPDTPKLAREYTVDIFTTFCAGEPYDMIRETLVAIKAIKYPHNTFLCDEADDPYLKSLCKEFGVIHVTRTVKIDAKAGNINNALKYSSADLCVILDPDHVPFPEFLDPIISHFNDPEVGFVQIVQSYKNQDQGLIAKGAAQQTYQFYGPIMMTMNKYGTVLAIGANCTFRRAALDSIGGHAAGLAEDMHTAMRLHAEGWKSVYVPAVVARGLVPSTLSAYYSQQLKWARGVFELLLTSYPRLFRRFTWQQKLHYGTIPMYYLSGIFILINFLIPVLSLALNTSPINFDFLSFIAIGFPLFMSVMLIRLFVQKWVMEEEERGVHVVGGLLMIGTWWVFLVGLCYTILRKKVPYIPTPKDNSEDGNWRLNIPNLSVIAASLTAIIYGLLNDWNPYNLIMAGFAGINCLILSFSVAASRQNQFRRYKEGNWLLSPVMATIAELKKLFWKFRRRVYRGIRSTALMLIVLVVCYSVYTANKRSAGNEQSAVQHRRDILIPGVFSSPKADGLTPIHQLRRLTQQSDVRFGIVSYYVPWGDEPQCYLPVDLLDSVYRMGGVPMVTWEPWQSLFEQVKNKSKEDRERKVFAAILRGDYDTYLATFSRQVKSLNRPVFIRFAHEADNPQYPWSAVGENAADEFKAAWRYVHRYFRNNHVYNVIWVWNPWKPAALNTYFPGEAYVDWLGVTTLNYGAWNDDKGWYNMKDLYNPFREHAIFRSGIPVMLAEMGSLSSEGRQSQWFQMAFNDIKRTFPEIRTVVFFDAEIDYNVPNLKNDIGFLNWSIEDFRKVGMALKNSGRQMHWLMNRPFAATEDVRHQKKTVHQASSEWLRHIKGVNYMKGQNWFTNGHGLRKREIIADFSKMKDIGLNTVKYYGPTVYDRNILKVARQKQMNLAYGFWLPDNADFITSRGLFEEYAAQILKSVASLKDNETIVMWNIGNSPLHAMSSKYFKPDLFYHREAYRLWLRKLTMDIKAIDPKRPISVDVKADKNLNEHVHWLHYYVPDIDCFGLVIGEDFDEEAISEMEFPYFYSRIDARDYLTRPNQERGSFIANWQDERTPTFVSFDGLLDDFGRSKIEMYQLANRWQGTALPEKLPVLKILPPATALTKNQSATYHILVRDGENWRLLEESVGLTFEWKLIKTNRYGEPLETKLLGNGFDITFEVPGDPANYKVALYASNNSQVKVILSNLNTTLHRFQWTEEAWSSFKLKELSGQLE